MNNPSKILAIDTVTEGCSAALWIEGEVVEQFEETPRGHTQRILPMVDQLLSEAGCSLKELDAIAYDRGPGSFTGLRITAGMVQGLAYGADLPVVAVSSLAALAYAQFQQDQSSTVLAAIDARMGEVYWGAYRIEADGEPVLQGEEVVIAPALCAGVSGEWVGVGSGWGSYQEALEQRFQGQLSAIHALALPHAAAVASLGVIYLRRGALLSAEQVQPLYLRNNVAHQQRKK